MDTRTDAFKVATGAAIGALAMYLLDPQRGRERRAEIGDTMTDLAHNMQAEDGYLRHDDGRDRYLDRDFDAREAEHDHGGGRGLLPLVSGVALAAYAWHRFGSGQKSADGRIDVSESIEIDAPPETVFDLWTNYENFPYFMANVEEVRALDGNRSHWIVKGPAGARVAFDSMLVTKDRPRLLAWRSEPGSEVHHEGRVRLEPSARGTRATVHMRYRPPGGALGHAVASMFGRDPDRELADDLQRMKRFIETGVPASGAAHSPGEVPLMTSEQAGAGVGAGGNVGQPRP